MEEEEEVVQEMASRGKRKRRSQRAIKGFK